MESMAVCLYLMAITLPHVGGDVADRRRSAPIFRL